MTQHPTAEAMHAVLDDMRSMVALTDELLKEAEGMPWQNIQLLSRMRALRNQMVMELDTAPGRTLN